MIQFRYQTISDRKLLTYLDTTEFAGVKTATIYLLQFTKVTLGLSFISLFLWNAFVRKTRLMLNYLQKRY